jgi:hypothetical protein
MYKKNSINKIKKQNHTHKRTKKRSYGKPSNKKNTKHNKRTQKYGYYNKNNKITKKRVYNKKKKVLIGGVYGAAVVVPKIMICTKNNYEYLIPVLTYLQETNKFLDNTIDVIYANGKNSESLLNQSIKLKSITGGKIKSIFNEAFIMMTTPFIIYIDDDNEIIKSKETQISKQFGMYLYKYKVEKSRYDLNEEPGINIDNDNYEETINNNSGYKCLCIHLPYETTSICDDIYYNLIKDILLFIKQKFANNLLTVFDFDNTLTQLHLFKSIVKGYGNQYTQLKEKEFNTAFLNLGNNDDKLNKLKEAEINKYFGVGNIQKILELFEIIKKPALPIAPKAPIQAEPAILEAKRLAINKAREAEQVRAVPPTPLKLIRAEQSMGGKTQNFFPSLKKTIASPTPKAPSIKEHNQRLAKLQTNLEANNTKLQQRALNAKAQKDAQIAKLLESQTSNNAQIEQQIAQKKAETGQRLATIKAADAQAAAEKAAEEKFLKQIANKNQANIETEIEYLNAQTEELRAIIANEEAESAKREKTLQTAEDKSHTLNHKRISNTKNEKQEELAQIQQKGIIAKQKLLVNNAHIKVLELLNTVYEQMSNLKQPNNTQKSNQLKEWNTQIQSSKTQIEKVKRSVEDFQTKAKKLVDILSETKLETEKAEAEKTLKKANNYMTIVTNYEQKLQTNTQTITQSLPLAKSIRKEEERKKQLAEKNKQLAQHAEQQTANNLAQNLLKKAVTSEIQSALEKAKKQNEKIAGQKKELEAQEVAKNLKIVAIQAFNEIKNKFYEIYKNYKDFLNLIQPVNINNKNNQGKSYRNNITNIKEQTDILIQQAEASLISAKAWDEAVNKTTMNEYKTEARHQLTIVESLMTLLDNFSKEINTELKNLSNIKTKKKSRASSPNNSTKTNKSFYNKEKTFFNRLKQFFDKNKDEYKPLINVIENETESRGKNPNFKPNQESTISSNQGSISGVNPLFSPDLPVSTQIPSLLSSSNPFSSSTPAPFSSLAPVLTSSPVTVPVPVSVPNPVPAPVPARVLTSSSAPTLAPTITSLSPSPSPSPLLSPPRPPPVPPPFAAPATVLTSSSSSSSSSVSNPFSSSSSSSVSAPVATPATTPAPVAVSTSTPVSSSSPTPTPVPSTTTIPAPVPDPTPIITSPATSPSSPPPTKHLSELTKMLWRLEESTKI